MARGTLPSYARLAHIPNILEGYRFLTRINLTTLSSQLCISYPTVRRICTVYGSPQERTMHKITEALPFITWETWGLWKDRCGKALLAERLEDIVTLRETEEALEAMLPASEINLPIHFIAEATMATASKLYTGSRESKVISFYLNDLHKKAVSLLSIKLGVSRSELIRLLLDKCLRENPEVTEALVREVTGMPAQYKPPELIQEDEVLVDTIQELEALVPSIPPSEVLTQLTASLPEDLPESIPSNEETETPILIESVEYSDDAEPINTWAATTNLVDESTNLTPEEIAAMFSGES